MIELGRVQHAKARFVERKYLKLLKQPLELTGTLEYRAPDHLERRTLTPKPESFVVDGDASRSRTRADSAAPSRCRTTSCCGLSWKASAPRSRGTLAALDRFYAVALDGGPRRLAAFA